MGISRKGNASDGDRRAVSRRGHLAGAYMFRAGSIAGDFSANARNDIVLVWFYTAGGLRPTFNTAEREKSYVFFCEAIFDENFKRLPHSRDKFRCSARQTRRKSPDSTTGTAGDLRPTFNMCAFLARRFLMKCAKTVRRKTKTVLRVRRGFTIGRVFNAVRKKRPPKGS